MQRYFKIIAVFSILILACNTIKNPSPEEIQRNLVNAMQGYLHETQLRDSNKVLFTVKSVSYYEELKYYICDFSVHMQSNPQKLQVNVPKIDTLGTMHCRISKDFQTVTRVY